MTPLHHPRTRTQQLMGLAGWLALRFVTAGVGVVASANAKGFYSVLVQPGWLFRPVWTVLCC